MRLNEQKKGKRHEKKNYNQLISINNDKQNQ